MAKVLVLLLTIGMAMPGLAQECRRQGQAWRPCSLDWIDPGHRWDLRTADEHWQISHDGSGTVQLREGTGPWRPAVARWQEPGVLCWGKLCARGPMPLD